MKCFTYADQNHTYSNLLHLIYRVANYLGFRHVVSNSHRAMVYHSNLSPYKIFPGKLFFFTVCLLDLSIYIPLNTGINLAKIDLVSARHLKEISQILETCSQDIRNTFQMRR